MSTMVYAMTLSLVHHVLLKNIVKIEWSMKSKQ